MMTTDSSLKQKVLKGSLWLYVLQGFSIGLLIIQTVVLARLLAPEHFGIVGIYLIISAAIESFTKTGFSKALVQRKNIDSDFLDTAWTVSIIRGLILFTLLFLCSTIVVEFFNTPKALPVIRVLGFSILLQGFYNPGTVYFSRDLDFFKQFLWKGGGVLANFLTSIPLVFILRNEWAIVWGMLASNIVVTVLSFSLNSYRPKLKFKYEVFKKLFTYSKWLLLSGIIAFFIKQGDKIFVTKLLGETLLGIYIIAWRFARIPQLLTKPLPNALFPAYSKFQDNPKALKEKYIETLKVISLFYIPLVGGMIVLARPFISIFLGEKWVAAVIPTQILTAAVGIGVLISISLSLFNATGKTSFAFKTNLIGLLALSVLVYPLVNNYGVAGAALCFVSIALARLIVWKIEINKLIEFKITDLNCILVPVISTVITAVTIIYVGRWLDMNHPGLFIGITASGVAFYLVVGWIIGKVTGFTFLDDVIKIYKNIKVQI